MYKTMSFNLVILKGEVVGDVRSHKGSTSTSYAFRLQTSKAVTKKDGSTITITAQHNISYWSKEDLTLTSGMTVLVQGELAIESWADKQTGEKKYKNVVDVKSLTILGSANTKTEEMSIEDVPF